MADGREEGRAQLVALHERLGLGRLGLESLALERHRELGREGIEHRGSAPRRSGTSEPELDPAVERELHQLGALHRSRPRPGAIISSRGSLRTTVAWSSRKSATRLASSSGNGIALAQERPGHARQRLGSLRVDWLGRSTGSEVDEVCSTTPATTMKAS